MVQAGASDVGRDLAARTADVVFTAAQTFEEAKAFYDDLKGRMAAYGREPDDIKIMPGVAPVVAETEAEAREKHEELQDADPRRCRRCAAVQLSQHLRSRGAIRSTGRCPNCRRAKA